MSNKKGSAPKNAQKAEGLNVDIENPAPTNDQVIVVGTGTGLLELNRKYTCPEETAKFHLARGYATLLTDQEAEA